MSIDEKGLKAAREWMGELPATSDEDILKGAIEAYEAAKLTHQPDESSQVLRPTEMAYLELLRLPLTDQWRALNQDILARLRDEIAADWQWDAENVQNHFEDIAAVRKHWPAKPKSQPDEMTEDTAVKILLQGYAADPDTHDHHKKMRHAARSLLAVQGADRSLVRESQPDECAPIRDDKLIALLEKLSCLGNGNLPGNSIGNTMAQEALEMAKNPPYATMREMSGDKDAIAKRLRAWLSEEYFTEADICNLTNEIAECYVGGK